MGALSNVFIEMDSRRAASYTLTHAENDRGIKLDLVLLHRRGIFRDHNRGVSADCPGNIRSRRYADSLRFREDCIGLAKAALNHNHVLDLAEEFFEAFPAQLQHRFRVQLVIRNFRRFADDVVHLREEFFHAFAGRLSLVGMQRGLQFLPDWNEVTLDCSVEDLRVCRGCIARPERAFSPPACPGSKASES